MKTLKPQLAKTLRISLILLLLPITAGCGGKSGASGNSLITNGTTLTWTAPTTNVDGSELTDLAGYKVYYGISSRVYSDEIDVEMPTCTDVGGGVTECTYTIRNLNSTEYYFAVTAYDASGNESDYSNEASKTF